MFPPAVGIDAASDREGLFLRAMMDPHRFEGAMVVRAYGLLWGFNR